MSGMVLNGAGRQPASLQEIRLQSGLRGAPTYLYGYGTNYVVGRPDSLGVSDRVKTVAQFKQDQVFFQSVEADASQKLDAARQRKQPLTDEVSRVTGADRLRKEAEQAVAAVDEMSQEITQDEAKANKLHADFEASYARFREKPRDVRLDGDRQKRLMDERDALRNGIPVKQSEKDLRAAHLNKLMADVAALDAGQDVREVNAAPSPSAKSHLRLQSKTGLLWSRAYFACSATIETLKAYMLSQDTPE